ncbi:hypothetical protein CUMW_237410 [Citrus unshiu]|uniref:CCHC-type domain-containing protein n=1 Tax=Citrus unshiu TaxID=55188 RepID=A0A2H5QJZ1_CITUN|nr:hypothetical protein CUMW_237410 [Citrus unshiu]
MEDHNELDEEFLGREEDLEFDTEDVTISEKESIPSISFSKKIHAQLVKPWMNAVVAKLLGRTIGYRALCNRLNDLRKMSQGFSVIDFFLVRFKTEGDAHYALTQDGKMQKVEYENFPVICFNCGIYGHKNENCPQLKTIKGATKNSENNGVGNITNSGGDKLWSSTVIPTNPSFRP